MSIHGDHPQEPAGGPYRNPVGDAMARGETPTMSDLVQRCTDLEDLVHAAVVMLSGINQRRIDRAAAGEHPALMVKAADVAELERITDQLRGRAGYVAQLRARVQRGKR